jgi:hypothetical protein
MLLLDIQDTETHTSDATRTLAVTLDAAKLSPLTVMIADEEKPRFALSALLTTGAVQPRWHVISSAHVYCAAQLHVFGMCAMAWRVPSNVNVQDRVLRTEPTVTAK